MELDEAVLPEVAVWQDEPPNGMNKKTFPKREENKELIRLLSGVLGGGNR